MSQTKISPTQITGVTGTTGSGTAVLATSPTITTPTISGLMASSGAGDVGTSGARFGTGYFTALNASGVSSFGSDVTVGAGGATGFVGLYQGAVNASVQINGLGASGLAFLDMAVAGGNADYDARVMRDTGANGNLNFYLRGTGSFAFLPQNSATNAVYIYSSGILEVNSSSEWGLRSKFSSATNSNRNHLLFQRAVSGGAVTNGTNLGGIAIAGHDGSAYKAGWNGGAEITAFASENWSGTANGTYLSFRTTPATTTTPVEAAALWDSGNFLTRGSMYPGTGSATQSTRYLRDTGSTLVLHDRVFIGTNGSASDPGANNLRVQGTIAGGASATFGSGRLASFNGTTPGFGNTNTATTFYTHYDAANIGNNAGDSVYPNEFMFAAGNSVRLLVHGYRRTASGSPTWTGTAWRLTYAVDNSFTDGSKAYVEIGDDGIQLSAQGSLYFRPNSTLNGRWYASGGLYVGASPSDPGANNLHAQTSISSGSLTYSNIGGGNFAAGGSYPQYQYHESDGPGLQTGSYWRTRVQGGNWAVEMNNNASIWAGAIQPLTIYPSGGTFVGASPADPGANNLQAQGQLIAGTTTTARTLLTDTAVQHYYQSETQPRFNIHRDLGGSGKAGIGFGPGGSTSIDTNLYRDSANVLKTDDSFAAPGFQTSLLNTNESTRYAIQFAITESTATNAGYHGTFLLTIGYRNTGGAAPTNNGNAVAIVAISKAYNGAYLVSLNQLIDGGLATLTTQETTNTTTQLVYKVYITAAEASQGFANGTYAVHRLAGRADGLDGTVAVSLVAAPA